MPKNNKTEVDSFKAEEEVDELDDNDFTSENGENDETIYDYALPLADVKVMTTQKLHSMIHEGEIDINPPYQRDVVWPETKQIALIDSIFRNFVIPPVIFAVEKDEEGQEVRVCVDGKQRLTSIQKFFDGQIPHRDGRNNKKYWFTTPPTSIRPDLPAAYKKMFQEKKITVGTYIEYRDIQPGVEREIFQRVQLGMPLTAAEKLQAIASYWAEWITQLETKHVSHDDGLSEKLSWDTKRGRDFQNLAHMVYCCDNYPDEALPTAQKLEKWMNRADRPTRQFQEDIDAVLTNLWFLATENQYNDAFTKIPQRVAPVEFIFIGVLLYVLRKETILTKSKAVYSLRRVVREEFRDIRNNSVVGKAMWKHISTLAHRPNDPLITNESKESATNKRKRTAKDEEDADEFRPKPIKSVGKAPKTRSKPASSKRG